VPLGATLERSAVKIPPNKLQGNTDTLSPPPARQMAVSVVLFTVSVVFWRSCEYMGREME
jgi:hypothetical protein